MDSIVIGLVALGASLLTFFSGFGLGTLLTPVMAIFFPIEVAIALTAVVHLLNNLFKLALVGKYADKKVVIQFGLPALIAAALGAWLLAKLTHLEPITQYQLLGKVFTITTVKLVIGLLLCFFALIELVPRLRDMQFSKEYLPLGGVLSGFFGGLSGNQGALRSAFLVRTGLSKEVFVATGTSIATLIDFSRLGIYTTRLGAISWQEHSSTLIVATICAFIGAWLGSKLLKKVTLDFVQKVVAVMLFGIAVGLIAGVI
jgi:uncharacterized membrane protein YfcA